VNRTPKHSFPGEDVAGVKPLGPLAGLLRRYSASLELWLVA